MLVGSPDVIHPLLPVIERSLAASGYVHGRNIVLRQQTAPPNPAEVERILRGVVPNVDLLIAGGTVGGVAAKKVTTTLPTVFLSVGDPVRVGLVASLAHPGGNMTGIAFEASSETYGKRLQLLKEIVPGLRVVGVLRAAGDANVINAMESFERAAPALNVTLRMFDLNTAEDVNEAFAVMKRDGVHGVTVIAGAFTFAHSRRIAELALTHRLPSSSRFAIGRGQPRSDKHQPEGYSRFGQVELRRFNVTATINLLQIAVGCPGVPPDGPDVRCTPGYEQQCSDRERDPPHGHLT